jgi:siroheme synthase (precorrin-2 oxidase/ferrochelatase)
LIKHNQTKQLKELKYLFLVFAMTPFEKADLKLKIAHLTNTYNKFVNSVSQQGLNPLPSDHVLPHHQHQKFCTNPSFGAHVLIMGRGRIGV